MTQASSTMTPARPAGDAAQPASAGARPPGAQNPARQPQALPPAHVPPESPPRDRSPENGHRFRERPYVAHPARRQSGNIDFRWHAPATTHANEPPPSPG